MARQTGPAKNPVGSDGIKIISSIPPGFVSLETFAERSGVGKPSISKARGKGKFPVETMRWVKDGKTTRPRLYLHWELAGVPYVIGRGRDNWPEGFTPPEDYTQDVAPNQGAGQYGHQKAVQVVDLNSAKLRKEQLIIQEKELNLQKARNEVVDMDEVITILQSVATETRQGFQAIKARNKKILAAEPDSHKIDNILDREFNQLADELEKSLLAFINGDTEAPEPEEWEGE